MSGFSQGVTFIYTADLARASRFYGELLGLELVLDQGACRIYRVAGEAFLGVCSHRPPRPEGVIITLVSDDVDGWAERLGQHGVELEQPPTRNPRFHIYHLFLRDPDGHLVEIQRFEDPRWPAAG